MFSWYCRFTIIITIFFHVFCCIKVAQLPAVKLHDWGRHYFSKSTLWPRRLHLINESESSHVLMSYCLIVCCVLISARIQACSSRPWCSMFQVFPVAEWRPTPGRDTTEVVTSQNVNQSNFGLLPSINFYFHIFLSNFYDRVINYSIVKFHFCYQKYSINLWSFLKIMTLIH